MSAPAVRPQVVPIPAEHAITLGAGRTKPQGKGCGLAEWWCQDGSAPVSPAVALAEMLKAIEPAVDAWWSPHTYTGDYRLGDRWLAAAAFVVDVDYCGAPERDEKRGHHKSTHAAPPLEVREQLEQAAAAGELPGNLFHLTPRGFRLVYLPPAPVTDRELYLPAIEGACVEVRRTLERLGLHAQPDAEHGCARDGYAVDEGATDLARFLFAPRAIVNGEQRSAEVRVLREEPCDLVKLAAAAPPPALKRAPAPKHNSTRAAAGRSSTAFAEAAERWNADHAQDWGRPGSGDCPACGHHGCFGRLPDNPARWCCFSNNHEADSREAGFPTPAGRWMGDALDLEAHARGSKRAEVLRADGYLADSQPRLRTSTKADVVTDGPEAEAPNPTDLGNAERLAARCSDRLRYCHPWQQWVVFDGQRWARDRMGDAVRMAKDTVRSIYAEAAAAPDEGTRKSLSQHAVRSENQRRIAGMLELAKSDPRIAVAPERFDGDATRDLLNVLNGTLNLVTGELRAHRPEDYITRLAPVEYRHGVRSERWESFLADVVPEPDVRTYLQRFAGYTLTGDTREQVFALLYGTGANGKSTFLETLKAMLGDYAHKAEFSTFLQSKADQGRKGSPRPDVLQLAGKRLVVAMESSEGRALDVATVKELTGGDTVTARGMYHNELTQFRPQAKLILAANHRPRIEDGTEAIWRRVHEAPFSVTIPEDRRDGTLPERLREPDELAGVLAWALDGCRAWRALGGLKAPPAVIAASRAYRLTEDFLSPFLEAKCVLDHGARSTASALFKAYQAWCGEVEDEPVSKQAFGRALRDHGFKEARQPGKGTRLWAGLRLADVFDPATEGQA